MRGQWDNAVNAMERANTPAVDLANEDQIKLNRVKKVGPPLVDAAGRQPAAGVVQHAAAALRLGRLDEVGPVRPQPGPQRLVRRPRNA